MEKVSILTLNGSDFLRNYISVQGNRTFTLLCYNALCRSCNFSFSEAVLSRVFCLSELCQLHSWISVWNVN